MFKKTILITGASDGIGKETAKELAKQGHKIIIHGRSKQKTQTAYQEIRNETGSNDIDVFLADFLLLAEVKRFADQIKEKYDHLDVLINNAGAQFTEKRETTLEGFEKTMAINVFAPFMLTFLLLDLLKNSQSARIVAVSSSAHAMVGKPDLNDFELESHYTMARSYALSKLYVIWIMRHFISEAEKLGIDNVTFNSVHPGSALTSLGREAAKSMKWKIIYFLWRPMMIPLEKAASSSIEAATSPDLEGVSGKYFGPNGEEKVNDKYYSPENEKFVWDYCMRVIKPYLKGSMLN